MAQRRAWYRWIPRGLGILITVVCVLAAGRLLWPQPDIDAQPGGTWRQLTFVRDAIDSGADDAAQREFPEGFYFMNALYGLAWAQAGQADPSHREQALRESRWALARLESTRGRAVFSPGLRPANGVFWAGWTNWLRGAILALAGSDDPAEVRRYVDSSAEIAQAFTASETPFLQAYPGQAWPVDSAVAIASLRLHDTLFDPRFDVVIGRWLDEVRSRLDPATGLIPHRVSPRDGSMLEGARATSQTVIHRFLPEIDSSFARAQYAGFRAKFLTSAGGFGPAIREYPHGIDGAGDVDSGPLVAGVSLSATVVALGAARVNGDERLAQSLGSLGELVGLPLTLPGTKRYAFGMLPIADAFLVWSSTSRLLAAPPPTAHGFLESTQRAGVDDGIRSWWRIPWLAVLGVLATAPWLSWLLGRYRNRRRQRKGNGTASLSTAIHADPLDTSQTLHPL